MDGMVVLLVALMALVLGFLAAKYWFGKSQTRSEVQAQVLLEKIKTVAKFVAVEGYFSEMYDYKDYKYYDFGFLRKKALVRVRAKVSVGFDMQKMTIHARAERKTLFLGELPKPEIISMEDEIDYYDISEGTFNSFKTEDYNKILAESKRFIREKAMESELSDLAELQGKRMLHFIKSLAEGMGWRVEMPKTLLISEDEKAIAKS